MTTRLPGFKSPLERAVEQVARRCRRRRWIYCGFRFGLASLALVLASTVLLASLPPAGFPRHLVLGLFVLAEGIALWRLAIRPLRQSIDLRRAALFIDEQRPELENRIVSAVEFRGATYDEPATWLIERLQDDSWRAARGIAFRDLLDSRRALRWTVAGILAWLGVFACMSLYRNLWVPKISLSHSTGIHPIGKSAFTVEPGNVRIRRGESTVVRLLSEKPAHGASILWRESGGEWQTTAMEQGVSPEVHFHQFRDVRTDISYQVRFVSDQSNQSDQSETYHIAVWTPPEVASIDLTYRYPEYLNLPPAETTHGGDITAVAGSKVDIAVHVNKPLKSAQLTFQNNPAMTLRETQPNLWEATLRVAQNDVYRVQLLDHDNAANEFVPEYRITAQPDNPPDVKIAFPRGDLDVTSLDEIPFEFKLDDDFGLSAFGIQIEVAGREPVRLPLELKGTTEVLRAAEGRHTMMLETLNLAPGDLVTWAIWAEDKKPDRATFETLGSPYFLEIRPFRREFEEAVSNQSAQNRQQQGDRNQQAANQKEVLIATWNLRRDAKNLTAQQFDERLSKIKEAQTQIKQRTTEGERNPLQNLSDSPKISEAIDKALQALDRAKWPEPSAPLSEAIRHMQTAHQLMLKSRPERSQVQMARNMSGNQNPANQREIEQLELSRNRNFYEQERRVQQQREATQRALNELKDLARRQQGINEEINKLLSEMQRRSAEEQKELARQLERLREEEQNTLRQLDQAERNMATDNMDNRQARETSQSLREARRQMTRSLNNMERGEFQQARAAGSRAVRALDEAQEALQRLSREAAAERIADLQQRMRAMGQREEQIQKQIADLKQRHEAPGSIRQDQDLDRSRKEVVAEKGNLAEEFRGTIQDAAELAKGAEKSQELMARRLGDWLRQTSREEIPEQMESARPLVEYGIWDPAMEVEKQVREKLDKVERNLADVAKGAVQDDLEGMKRALDELRRLREAERDRRNQSGQSDKSDRSDRSDKSDASDRSERPGGQAGWDNWVAPRSDEQMRLFLERDSQDWTDRIRDAEALLPDDSDPRRRLGQAREALLTMRRNFRGLTSRAEGPPRFDLFKELVAVPLGLAAEELERQIHKHEDAEKLVLTDEDTVPEKYRKPVARYYQALSDQKER